VSPSLENIFQLKIPTFWGWWKTMVRFRIKPGNKKDNYDCCFKYVRNFA
jgi:hypothetical protein